MVFRNLVGPRVRQARLERGLTQAQLAARLQSAGFSLGRASVSKIESRIREVDDRELVALSDALSVSPAWLLDHGAENASPRS